MISRGKLQQISLNYKTRATVLTVETNCRPEEAEKLLQKDLSIELKQYRAKRSLDANAYYWVLVTRIAKTVGNSNAYIHNEMLRKYGQIEVIDGQAIYLVIPDTDEAQKRVDEAETYHLRPTSQTRIGKDGKTYRTYMMLRGSHEYDSAEMAALINGVVSEAKDLGIETMSPDELKRMMKAYEEQQKKRS